MVVMGGSDKIIDPHVAFELFTKSRTAEEDKEILFYDKMFHLILYEPEMF
jgi:esterase/lipase